MKTPTNKEKIQQYEAFLHKINACIVSCNHEAISELIQNADNWSYAHRRGNGELTDKQQDSIIAGAFWRLLDTPKADKITQDRQKAYMKTQKQKHEAFLKSI